MAISKSSLVERLSRGFLLSASVIFLATGAAKAFSLVVAPHGPETIFATVDPILGLRFDVVFAIAGGIELVIGALCLFRSHARALLYGVFSISVVLWIYRLGLWFIDYQRPCSCLGTLTDALHVNPETADLGMRILLGYLTVGSLIYMSLYKFTPVREAAASATLSNESCIN